MSNAEAAIPGAQTVRAFLNAAYGWAAVEAATAGDVVRAAAEVVAAGMGGPAVAYLAGESVTHFDWLELAQLVGDAVVELGAPFSWPDRAAVEREAFAWWCVRVVDGSVHPRDLARWAHGLFGHNQSGPLDDLALADDLYDDADSVRADTADVDARVRECASVLVAAWPALPSRE